MENKRKDDPPHLPDVYLLDLLYTQWWRTGQYNLDRIIDFKEKMAAVSTKTISDDDLAQAIATANENRRLMQKLDSKRRHHPPLISGTDVFEISAAASCMQKTEHSRLLKALLEDDTFFSPKASTRLMFSGHPNDATDLYRLIEGCNATIILEDHDWGCRPARYEVAEDADPLQAITERYHRHAVSPRIYPPAELDQEAVAEAIEMKVDGVIFFFVPHSADSWDYPNKKAQLEQENIKTLLIQPDQVTLKNATSLNEDIKDFIARLS
jgi:benzoyl-CoA reductase/2-hydroxyglutaryl-CoA dehydratase subunit BcrC/BadD/HgdB